MSSVALLALNLRNLRNLRISAFVNNLPHVYRERGEAKFWLQPDIELAQNHGLSDRDIRTAEGLIEGHRDEIHEAWKKHFGS